MRFSEVSAALNEGKKVKLTNWKNAFWYVSEDKVLMNHFESGKEAPVVMVQPMAVFAWVATGDWEVVTEPVRDRSEVIPVFSFSTALECLKEGKRVSRMGWNGKGMFLVLTPGNKVPAQNMRVKSVKKYYQAEEQEKVTICPHIDLKAADNTYVTGWLASQTDMLADDWYIVEEEKNNG